MEWERQRAYDRQAGKDEGLTEGRLEGQHDARIESAENLIKEGVSLEVIARCTGLSLEEVEELAKKVNVTA